MADVDPVPQEEVENPAVSNAASTEEFANSLSRFAGSTNATDRADAVKKLQGSAFGEKGADADEEEDIVDARMRAYWKGILHPDTNTRGLYDFAQLLIMIWLGYMLPTRLAFNKSATGAIEVALDLVIDASVWVDMYMQMRMCSYDKKTKKLIHDPAKIRKDYLRSWFLIDFFSVVPADQVLLAVGTMLSENTSSDTSMKLGLDLIELSVSVRLMRLLRLVRLLKLKDLLNLDKIIHSLYIFTHHFGITKLQLAFYFRLFFLVALIVSSGHFLGCIWLMLGRHNVLQMVNPEGWMVSAYEQDTVNHTKDFVACTGDGFDAIAWNLKHGQACQNLGGPSHACVPIPPQAPYDVDCSWIMDRAESAGGTGNSKGVGASESEQYLSAFYFSLVTVTTVGYGDILPDTPAEKQFVILCIITGAFLYAYVIGDFTLLLTNLSQERDEYDSKMRSVNDLLSYIEAPPELRQKVQNYYDFKYRNKEGKSELIEELPTPIQDALIQHRYGRLIARVPFFATLTPRAVVELCMQLKSFTVPPRDSIMRQGEWNDELLILSKGAAKTQDRDKAGRFTSYEVGSFWGELQFLGLERQRTLTVVATTYCEVASLAPGCVDKLKYGIQVNQRLEAYAAVRQSVELSIARGEEVDMVRISKELEERYLELDEGTVDEDAPPPVEKIQVNTEEGGQLSEVVMDTLYELQKAQRASEIQLARLNEKTNAQLASMMQALDSMQTQLKEQGEAQAAAAAAAAEAFAEVRADVQRAGTNAASPSGRAEAKPPTLELDEDVADS